MGVARILVVDDEGSHRGLLTRLLVAEGYEVTTAGTGADALLSVRANAPDLVLLDVQMPGIDGFDVCRMLKDQAGSTPLLPVILVTGLDDHQHKLAGIEAGADDFLSKPFDHVELKARVASLLRLKRYTDELDSAEAIIRTLAITIEARDAYTEGHCERLSHYSVALGRTLRLPVEEIEALSRGGYLHDLGKIGISDTILLKPGPLTPAEYALMKEHTVIGDRLCGELRAFKLVRQIVRHHHERFDGSGYPDGLRGDGIPLLAQVVSIVDAYDAMTTDRPYQKARSSAEACEELHADVVRGCRSGELVRAFVALHASGGLLTR